MAWYALNEEADGLALNDGVDDGLLVDLRVLGLQRGEDGESAIIQRWKRPARDDSGRVGCEERPNALVARRRSRGRA